VIKEATLDMVKFFMDYQSQDAIAYILNDSKLGLIDRNGEIIIPVEYDEITVWNIDKSEARIIKDKQVGVFDIKNKRVMIPAIYYWIIPFANDPYFLIGSKTERGICDNNHNIIVPIKYKTAYHSTDTNGNIFFIGEINNLKVAYSKEGKQLKEIPKTMNNKVIEEEEMMFFDGNSSQPNTSPMSLDFEKLGFEAELYFIIKNPKNGKQFGVIKKDGLFGVVDETSKLILDIEYRRITKDHDFPGVYLYGQNELYGWFSLNAKKILLPTLYSKIESANKYMEENQLDTNTKKYLFVNKVSPETGGFFDKETGQIFLPKEE